MQCIRVFTTVAIILVLFCARNGECKSKKSSSQKSVFDECRKSNKLSKDELKPLMKGSLKYTKEHECFLACIQNATGWYKPDRSVNTSALNETKMEQFTPVLQKCKDITDADSCVRAGKINTCMAEKSKESGLSWSLSELQSNKRVVKTPKMIFEVCRMKNNLTADELKPVLKGSTKYIHSHECFLHCVQNRTGWYQADGNINTHVFNHTNIEKYTAILENCKDATDKDNCRRAAKLNTCMVEKSKQSSLKWSPKLLQGMKAKKGKKFIFF